MACVEVDLELVSQYSAVWVSQNHLIGIYLNRWQTPNASEFDVSKYNASLSAGTSRRKTSMFVQCIRRLRTLSLPTKAIVSEMWIIVDPMEIAFLASYQTFTTNQPCRFLCCHWGLRQDAVIDSDLQRETRTRQPAPRSDNPAARSSEKMPSRVILSACCYSVELANNITRKSGGLTFLPGFISNGGDLGRS